LLWLIFGFNMHKWNQGFIISYNATEIHHHPCGIDLKKSKLKPFSVFCAYPWASSEPNLHKTCHSLN
jgi:hypothetical protein